MNDIISAIGWTAARDAELRFLGDPTLEPGRVTRVDRGLVTLVAANGEHRLPTVLDEPAAVGDWLAFRPGEAAVQLLERTSLLARRVQDGHRTVRQLLASNIDAVVIVRALDMELRTARIQQLLTIAYESGAEPAIVLTKADAVARPADAVAAVEAVAIGVPVFAVSAVDGTGITAIRTYVGGRTIVLLGESGAGKSTLTNLLVGREVLATGEVRRDGTGRHTTSRRELLPLPDGGAIIDTPGVREAGYWGDGAGVDLAFADVAELAIACRFSDCTHDGEPGCAVEAAIDDGTLHPERLDAYRHALREAAWLARREDKRARSEERARWKQFSKSLRRDAW